MKITLIGLGVNANLIPLKAVELIKNAKTVICRTKLTSASENVLNLNANVIYLDFIYESSRNFDTLNKKLANYVLKKAKTDQVVYCVDGSICADNSCNIIMNKCKNVEVIDGLSHSQNAMTSCKIGANCTQISAYDINKFSSSFLLPLVVFDLDSKYFASAWKLALSNAYGDEVDICIYQNGSCKNLKIYQLDWLDSYDYSTVLIVKDVPLLKKQRFNIDDLFNILRILRGENGCPWDRVQTRDSIKNNLIEECYELYDAICNSDLDNICEELGDMLLQIAFHILFGEEEGTYNASDVISNLCKKLIFRHSHIFGDDLAKDDSSALDVWEKNKAKEKGYETGSEYLDLVPRSFPSLMYAQKLQKRASKYNFDFDNVNQIYDKIQEEINEFKNAVLSGDENQINIEAGDLLFSVVNLIRFNKLDSEQALKLSSEKFLKRFKMLENAITNDGKSIKELTLTQIDKYYNEIKKH